ncbi:MAG TPA: hypothetical protein VL418_02855 [Devosiaceae bacterium]|nr:hypothetical protein [Devosiaceae bacterium]
MQGQILQVGNNAGGGLILGDDGSRYQFALAEWRVAAPAMVGMAVDYVPSGDFAREIYPLPAIAGPSAPARPSIDQSNSALLGVVAVGCLLFGFVVPVLPTFAAFVVGLIGAGAAKRTGDGAGLVLSRLAWIGALLILLAEAALVATGFGLVIHLIREILRTSWGVLI